MWWGSGQDPGGSEGEGPPKGPPKEPPQNQQLLDLQEQFESQQTLIAQLKEMLKKTDNSSSVSREKVEEYASTLSKMNARAKQSKLRKMESIKGEDDGGAKPDTIKGASGKKTAVVTPAKQKVNLLRQQIEENRLKLAQRDKNQKGIEEKVNQLKAQLDDSQIMINQSTINLPKIETKPVPFLVYTTETAKEDLIMILQNKDKQMEELNSRLQQLQGNVLDLQENLKEKDSVIDARTKAITLLSENLSKKGKNTLDMLEDTKEQMRTMQEHFVNLEAKMKEENAKLTFELKNKNKEIEDLKQSNCALGNEKNQLEIEHNELKEKWEVINVEFNNCKTELSTSDLKIQELSNINQELEKTISGLKNKHEESVERSERSSSSSPQRSGKQKSKSWKKSKQAKLVPEISSEKENLDRIAELEKMLENLTQEHLQTQSKISEAENIEEIQNLKKQLETMNKNMIKTKAQYKAKLKDLQKKATPGEMNEKILNLESENVKLEQRIAELEEEKGNLQLRLVDVDVNKDKEHIADLENRIEEQKMEIENHIRTITTLETQITDKSTEISSLRNELANLIHIENAQVCSEITSVQLEEQLDKEVSQKKEIFEKYEAITKENENLLEKIEELNKEKQEMNTKLVNYMQENMELMDRLEKSSAEKVSSAESIEIVESLTQQEKLEIEAYQKNLEYPADKESIEPTDLDPNSELTESVTKLSEDSSELIERIELFTVERREVMEKMDSLLSEKEHLLGKLGKLEKEKVELIQKYESLCAEKDQLVQQVELQQNFEKVSSVEDKFDETDGIRMDSSSNTALIEEYQILIENQKGEISQLKEEITRILEEKSQLNIRQDNIVQISREKEGLEIIISSLNEEFLTLHKEYESFLTENQKLKEELKKNSEQIFEKDAIFEEYNIMKLKLIKLEAKVTEDVEEINILQNIMEENKSELIKSAEFINTLTNELSLKQSELAVYQKENEQLHSIVEQLNNEIDNKNTSCDNHVETIDLLSIQLQELKHAINENCEVLQRYEELNKKISKTDQIIEHKDSEIMQLKNEKSEFENQILNLEVELKHKDEHFKNACQSLKDKCMLLENKIQANSGSLDDMRGPLENKIVELENECKKLDIKNKELVEKLKKIAANLKKKAITCQELETKLQNITEKWENECREKDEKVQQILEQEKKLDENKNKMDTYIQKLEEINNELNDLTFKLETKNQECAQLKIDYQNHVQQLQNENIKLHNDMSACIAANNTLQNDKTDLRNEIEELNKQVKHLTMEAETYKDDKTVENLLTQLDELQLNFTNTKNALDAKIQEKDMCIETLETENINLKEKLGKLNEGLLQVEERRQLLEKEALKLGEELEAKVSACEEVTLSENFLENRLAAIIAHDEMIDNKLKEITALNHSLNNQIDKLSEDNLQLQRKLSEIEIKLKEKEKECEKFLEIEHDSLHLHDVVSHLEHENKKLHVDFEKKVFEKNAEIENMEQELNSQIEEHNNLYKAALNKCELLEERIQEFSDSAVILNEEIDQLKQKLSDVKADFDKELQENDKLRETNSNNLLIIDQLNSQMLEFQMFKNNMHSMEIEITKLNRIIAEKENDIQNYQRQNIQLQMSISNESASLFDTVRTSSTHRSTDTQDVAALQKQIHDLSNEIKVAEEKIFELNKSNDLLVSNIEEYKKSLSALQEELSHQQNLLVRKTAEHHIDDIICTAQQMVEENKNDSTKMNSSQELPIKKLTVSGVHANVSPSKQEIEEQELLKKIKALEFMLYSVEKEKDEAVAQCHSLSNELTRLIYERQHLIEDKSKIQEESKDVDMQKLEGEILSGSDLADNTQADKEFSSLEYTPVKVKPTKHVTFDNSCSQPIEEEICQQKSMYFCYPEEKAVKMDVIEEASGWEVESDRNDQLESQIVKEHTIQQVQIPKSETTPETHIKDISIDFKDVFIEEEDGWGLNAEEIKLELKHQQSLQTAIPVQSVNKELEQRVKELEAENTKFLEDIKAHEIKAAKLIKKLKELKAKNDNLNLQLQQKPLETIDVLDMAIQDELNAQINNLESKLKEVNNEKLKEKAERENLLKRIDMLTVANERMVEMKEKQDTEIQMLQFNNRQLSLKLEKMDWDNDNSTKEDINNDKTEESSNVLDYKKEYENINKKVEEMNSIINDLTIDNEEMQLLLEEQRKLRLDAEKALANISIQQKMKTEQEYAELYNEKEHIKNHLTEIMKEKEKIEKKLAEYIQMNCNLCLKVDQIGEKVKELIQEKNALSYEYTLTLEELQRENKKLHEQISSIEIEVENTADQSKEIFESEMKILRDQITKLETDKLNLGILLDEKENLILELNLLIENLKCDKNNLEFKVQEISGAVFSENVDQMEGLGDKLEIIVKEIQNKNKEVSELNNILNIERAEFEQKLTSTLEQLANEWAERVEQRGSDVAESWKLHVETRENEFMQLEQALRLEVTEVCNKNEGLLIENNELQKKVELLLQEKQAAISDNKTEALQQILTERQAEIISLSQQLQDVSVQLEVKNSEINSIQQVIDSIKQQNTELIEKNEELKINCEQLKELTSHLTTETKDMKKYTKQNEELSTQLTIADQELEILRQTVSGLQKELSKVSEELNDTKLRNVEYENNIRCLQENVQKESAKHQELVENILLTFNQNDISVTDVPSFDYASFIQQRITQMEQEYQISLDEKKKIDQEIINLSKLNSELNNSVSQYIELNDNLRLDTLRLSEKVNSLEKDLSNSIQLRKESEDDLNAKMKEIESQEQVISEKAMELEKLQIEFSEYQTKEEINISNLNLELQGKTAKISELEAKINELNMLSTEENIQLNQVRQLLQENSAEIEHLNEELKIKTDSYNSLLQELENMKQLQHKQLITPTHEKHVHFKEPLEPKSRIIHQEHAHTSSDKVSVDAVDTEPVNRAELDLALYMLHQRDVRCEELTVELMQLLEERDTLQLRLSNAIRINEELRSKTNPQNKEIKPGEELDTPKVFQSTGAIPKSKSSDIVLKAIGTELATEATEQVSSDKVAVQEKEDLKNKLSQLHSVGYRDKTLKDDQEIRYLQQMSIMQQHRDIASRLPPEAAAKLVDASYTLSRDVQSPSKVLLNWLWGKSTPKVNDI